MWQLTRRRAPALAATAAVLTLFGLAATGCGASSRPAPQRSSTAATIPGAARGTGAPSATPSAAGRPGAVTGPSRVEPCVSGTCWVAVTVATAWVEPWYPRPVDAPALASPADPSAWIADMTLDQKQWLVGRLETQVLYGDPVIVTGHWQDWVQVAVPGQPTNRDSRGYPGWIPAGQLTSTAPTTSGTVAVTVGSTWLWARWTADGVSGSRLMLASYGTSLPVVRVAPAYVVVALIGGQQAAARRADVILHAAGASWAATRAAIVAEASRFVGLPYLWAGTSGFGFDCSGFVYSVYRRYGITLARDADQQAAGGTPVASADLTPGDLVFFRGSSTGPVSHVGLYIGDGNMIDAPHTGAGIRIEPVSSFSYYAGARRYLTA
jgi:gamma-D-glutamyl-L-lysine dipeptidyl-peptidase